METFCFHTKLPSQKPMSRQIEWGVQNGPKTKNELSPVTTLFKPLRKLRPKHKQ